MEDAHTAELQLDEDKRSRNAFFAVYDGHGGMMFSLGSPVLGSLNPNRSKRCQIRGEQRLQASDTGAELQGWELSGGSQEGVSGDRRRDLVK